MGKQNKNKKTPSVKYRCFALGCQEKTRDGKPFQVHLSCIATQQLMCRIQAQFLKRRIQESSSHASAGVYTCLFLMCLKIHWNSATSSQRKMRYKENEPWRIKWDFVTCSITVKITVGQERVAWIVFIYTRYLYPAFLSNGDPKRCTTLFLPLPFHPDSNSVRQMRLTVSRSPNELPWNSDLGITDPSLTFHSLYQAGHGVWGSIKPFSSRPFPQASTTPGRQKRQALWRTCLFPYQVSQDTTAMIQIPPPPICFLMLGSMQGAPIMDFLRNMQFDPRPNVFSAD